MEKKMRRLLTLFMTFCLLFSWLAVSVSAAENIIDKTAAWSDDGHRFADVSLSVPGDVKVEGADIVFVVDKSSCGAYATAQFKEMFNELAAAQAQSGAIIKVGLVQFNYTDYLDIPLTELTSDNVDDLLAMIGTYSGGTNMESGLRTAYEMLAADHTVSAENKHVILISDGLTWIYDDEASNPTTILWKNNNGEVNAGTQGYTSTRGVSYLEVPDGYTWDTYWAQIQEWIRVDGNIYDHNISDYNQPTASEWKAKLQIEGKDVALTLAEGKNHAVNMDRAMYDAWLAYTALQNAGYNCYVNNLNTNAATNGYNFMNMLAGNQKAVDFESIKNTIIYSVSKGSYVEDIIGYDDDYNFDFMVDGKITLTVAGNKYTTTKLGTAKDGFDASYEFTAPNATEATFWLDYAKGNGTSTEKFIWTFGEDLSVFYPAKLDYQVELVSIVNDPTEAEAFVDTNKSATLYPKDSDGNEGTPEEFPVPTLNIPKYKVEYKYDGYVPENAPEELPATAYYFAGNAVQIESNEDYQVEEHVFCGWNDTENDLKDGIMPAKDVLLTGYYVPIVHTLGSITVTKVTEGDAATPATATFQLQMLDGENWINVGDAVPYSAFVDGQYTFSDLTEGTYRVIEDGAEVEEFHLATSGAGEEIVLIKTTDNYGSTSVSEADTTVTNDYTPYIHELGSITVTKVTDGAVTPATATFQLQMLDGENWINVGEAVPYSAFVDGKYTFSGLTEGTYRVIEDGAEVEEFHLVTVDGEIVTLTKTTENNGDTSVNSGSIEVTNDYTPYIHELGSITVTKVTEGNAATPATATFQLQKQDGEEWINVGEAVAYSAFVDGKYTFSGLTEGTYRVIEDGAEIDEFHLATVDGEIVTLTKTTENNGDTFVSEADTTVTNAYTPYIHELGSITVTKTSTGAATPATATFQLQKQDGETWINVGEAVAYSAFVDGKYTFSDLTEGTYRVIESGAAIAEYHLVTSSSGNVVLTKTTENDGDTSVSSGSIEVTNAYTAYVHTLGSITVTKTSTGAATPATATFQLQKQDGETWINVGEAVPYSAFVDGKYTFSGLTEGSYRIIESGAAIAEYHLVTSNSGNVVLTKNYHYGDTSVSSGSIEVTNAYTAYVHTLGSITVTKTSTGAATPATATFQLQKQDGETWINVGEAVAYSAFVDGKYTFSGLTEGTYRVIESGAAIAEYHLVTSSSGNVVLTKTTEDDGDTSVNSGEISLVNEYEEEIIEIPEESVPEGPAPTDPTEDEEDDEIPEESVPEDPAPTDPTEDEEDDEIIEIPEDDVPRADVPNTGDQILPFVGMAIASGAAAIFVGKFGKKEDEEA